jgi:hypothetical protein
MPVPHRVTIRVGVGFEFEKEEFAFPGGSRLGIFPAIRFFIYITEG